VAVRIDEAVRAGIGKREGGKRGERGRDREGERRGERGWGEATWESTAKEGRERKGRGFFGTSHRGG
jgi:hypothetical protein